MKREKILGIWDRLSVQIYIVLVILSCALMNTGCTAINKITNYAGEKTRENTEIIDDFINGEDVDVGVKFDTYSAQDVINEHDGVYGESDGRIYYDEKSGQYVTRAQFRANNFVDALKQFWGPCCLALFVLGFTIRRINHSSATIRRFGLLLEIIFPAVLTTVVYVVCAIADSDFINIFDNIF